MDTERVITWKLTEQKAQAVIELFEALTQKGCSLQVARIASSLTDDLLQQVQASKKEE